jgi:hypothetical protein
LQACAEGISAVKAIAIAQSQGQKIYTINKENRDTALPKLTIGGAVGDEIRNAINAGKEVTFHENAINAFGWSGHGYIILDPETGVGAHLIDGGGSGAIYIAVGVIFVAMAITTMIIGGPASALAFSLLASEFALGIGYIVMGIGIILDKDNIRLAGAAIALGGVTAVAGIFSLISRAVIAAAEIAGTLFAAASTLLTPLMEQIEE